MSHTTWARACVLDYVPHTVQHTLVSPVRITPHLNLESYTAYKHASVSCLCDPNTKSMSYTACTHARVSHTCDHYISFCIKGLSHTRVLYPCDYKFTVIELHGPPHGLPHGRGSHGLYTQLCGSLCVIDSLILAKKKRKKRMDFDAHLLLGVVKAPNCKIQA